MGEQTHTDRHPIPPGTIIGGFGTDDPRIDLDELEIRIKTPGDGEHGDEVTFH